MFDSHVFSAMAFGLVFARVTVFQEMYAADGNRFQTYFHTVGESGRLDCNTSQNESQAVWQRKTLQGDEVLFAGLISVKSKETSHIKISRANYSIFLTSLTTEDEGFYICTVYGQTRATYHLRVFVPSDLRIQYKGRNITDAIFLDNENVVQLSCVVFRATQEPTMIWKFNNASLAEYSGPIVNSSNQFVNGTFNFRKRLTYLIKEDTVLICSSYGYSNISVSVTIYAALMENADHSTNYTTVLITATCTAILLICVVAVRVFVKCCRGSISSIQARTTTVPSKDRTLPSPTQSELVNISQPQLLDSDIHSTSVRFLSGEGNLKDSYARNISDDDCYSAVSYNMPSGKVFPRKRICLITKITDGTICERWIGNATSPHEGKKNVFISCLKGVISSQHFKWDVLVKLLLELPECPFIFRAHGICLDDHNLFLLQDFVACETFNDYLSTYGAEGGQDSPHVISKELTDICFQVTNGMEFAMSHGLSHPGLCMEKLLISEDNVCKLFDFCLTEDAPKLIEFIKQDADFKLSTHPQECVARNEYTCASDVWYTAFTVREIYFYGSHQIPGKDDETQDKRSLLPLTSVLCRPAVWGRLKECLRVNCNERAMNLRELLKALRSELDGELTETSMSNIENDNEKQPPYVLMDQDSEIYSLPASLLHKYLTIK